MNYKNILSEKFFDLDKVALENKKNYKFNKPFPSIYFDNFFDKNFLLKVRDEFPDLSKLEISNKWANKNELKFGNNKYESFKENTRFCFDFLNSIIFLTFLQNITSIEEKLISDPYLNGGGLHEIKKGGLLKIHTDFNKHGLLKLDRRVNVLIYLNSDWKEEYGGHIEFWDSKMKMAVNKILPIFNRVVIFSTTDYSNHGHPEPLSCPVNLSRKSLALYYFSNGRPKNEIGLSNTNVGTIFKNRENIKGDVEINYSKFRLFLAKFKFYSYLRSIRDKFFR